MDLIKIGIPAKFTNATLKNYLSGLKKFDIPQKVWEQYRLIVQHATSWMTDDELLCVYMKGINGCGKTALACAMVNEARAKRWFAMRVTQLGLYMSTTRNFNQIPGDVLSCGLLVMDELGKEFETTGNKSERMTEYVLKTRTDNRRRTIIIANCKLSEVETRYGPTVASVVVGNALPLNFPDVNLGELEGDKARAKYKL